jgi:hypothetical protein
MYNLLCDSMVNHYPAVMFSYPHIFRTRYDSKKGDRDSFDWGRLLGTKYGVIRIDTHSYWEAYRPLEPHLSTTHNPNEKIGFHPGTWALLAGFITSGVRIEIYREGLQEPIVLNETPEYKHSRGVIESRLREGFEF